jgi:hypothetical protein
MAAARRRRPAWQRRRQLSRSAISAVAAACLEVWRQHGGSGDSNVALAVATWHMLTMILMVTMTMMIDY